MYQLKKYYIICYLSLSIINAGFWVKAQPQNPEEIIETAKDQMNNFKDAAMNGAPPQMEDAASVPKTIMDRRPKRQTVTSRPPPRPEANDDYDYDAYNDEDGIVPNLDFSQRNLGEQFMEGLKNIWNSIAETMKQVVETMKRQFSSNGKEGDQQLQTNELSM